MEYEKRVALITGAGRGIGKSIAIELSKNNVHVILTGRTLSELEIVSKNICRNGGSASIFEMNITDHPKIDEIADLIFEKWGKLDIFVINAGILGNTGSLVTQDPDNFFKVININLISAHKLIGSFDFILRQSNHGRALIIGSGSAISKNPFMGAYAVSKAALEHMTYLWASETRNTKLRVNIIDPGATRTRMRSEAIPDENPKTLPTSSEVAQKIVQFTRIDFKEHGQRIKIRDIL
ncbi:SDR family NAD(P)-dependent oxidoreductase [Alphaproteobacteria bacterium]|nr:SDR family NAD(P)-dependent oxidoreductase [Alphaproteobacteria bacterium]